LISFATLAAHFAAPSPQRVAKLSDFASQLHDHAVERLFVFCFRTKDIATRFAFATLARFTRSVAVTTSFPFAGSVTFSSLALGFLPFGTLAARLFALTTFGTFATFTFSFASLRLFAILTLGIEQGDKSQLRNCADTAATTFSDRSLDRPDVTKRQGTGR
jgi:hypothetical protein